MKNAAIFSLIASAALAGCQVTQLPNGTFTCSTPNAAFCATGTSLGSPVIIRCDSNGVGQPGQCTDNLAGEPPLGVGGGALCWESSPSAGDASCEKNCVVYASSGTSVLPSSLCVPSFTASSSSSSATSTTTTTTTTTTTASTTSAPTTSKATSSSIVKTTITTLVTTITTTSCPPTSLSTGTGSSSTVATNGTVSVSSSGSATKKPVGPSSSTTGVATVATAGAATTGVSGMVIFGLIVAYML